MIVTAGALLGFFPAMPQLFITDDNTGNIIFIHDIHPEDTFYVTYIHSVNRSKVTDHFIITEDYQIMVDSTEFSAYGAGIPEPEEGQKITVSKDHVEIENLQRIVDPYRLFVGTIADHTITFEDDDTIHFKDLVPPKTPLVVDIKKFSLIKKLLLRKELLSI